MKILNVLHLPWFAGTERAYLSYCDLLQTLGYEVVCLIPRNSQVKKHLRCQVIEDDDVLLTRGKFNLKAIFKFRKLVKSQEIKAVFAHSGGVVQLFRKVLFRLNIPLISVNHGFGLKNITKADAVIALNKTSFIEMQNYVNTKKIFYLPNALNVNLKLYKAKKSTPKIIGVICRLTQDKGLEYFIQALSLLKSQGYNLKAKIAGDGEEMSNLIKLTKSKGLQKDVEFLGWVNDIKDFYSQIDVLCHPSLHEAFGLVLLEAMQYGVPIVSTITNGAREIIKHSESGLLAKIADPISLAEQITCLVKTRGLGQSLAKQAHKDLIAEYSYKVVAKRLGKILKQAIKEKSK